MIQCCILNVVPDGKHMWWWSDSMYSCMWLWHPHLFTNHIFSPIYFATGSRVDISL